MKKLKIKFKRSILMDKRYFAEFFGTALLLAVVTGSGIMGQTLSVNNDAIALLGNSIATGAGLYVLISILSPISGAHFNPLVTLMAKFNGELKQKLVFGYIMSQVTGAISGVWISHFMFNLPIMQYSEKLRTGSHIWFSEFISTLFLLSVIYFGQKYAKKNIAMIIGLTVTAGYWFTSSTFFANPAVTIARSLTNTFVGIHPQHVIGFIFAQLLALLTMFILKRKKA
jgi:glycerol uptake facilitator-like aquaporin